MNTVYQEASEFWPVRDSKYVAKEYHHMSQKIAECIAQMNMLKDHAEYLQDITHDNGDPVFDIDEAIKKLGIALATCVSYGKGYEDEANEGNTDEKQSE